MASCWHALCSLALVAVAGACRPTQPPEPVAQDSAPAGDPVAGPTTPAAAYAGTWIGPTLRLTFAGPWVLVGPRDPGPGAQPIELRASIERQAGDAFALRTSVADRYAADFMRPSDWTLLVEAQGLALAMGDEPLASYAASDEPALIGPVLLDVSLTIPGRVEGEDLLACLEVASAACLALEDRGPRALGCREAQWAVCVAHVDRGVADPTERAAIALARTIHAHAVELEFAIAVLAAAPAQLRPEAEAMQQRALERASEALGELAEAGPLPATDPNLEQLRARLAELGQPLD